LSQWKKERADADDADADEKVERRLQRGLEELLFSQANSPRTLNSNTG
jgi:hypothetical protein